MPHPNSIPLTQLRAHLELVPAALPLLAAVIDIAQGRYLDSCPEKRAAAYNGVVLMARDALERASGDAGTAASLDT